MCVCVVVFRMRRRARVAPPVDETEDEFLPPEPPVRRRGRGRARGRPHVASHCRQRDLRDNKPAEQDDLNAKFLAETPHGAEPIPSVVPLI